LLRPKNAQNSTKNGKNQLLQKKSLTSLWTSFPHCMGKIFFSP
jgi:hypothetical protein